MDTADLRDHVDFSESEAIRSTVLESSRLFAQTVCLAKGGSYGPVSDPDADAFLTILAGEAAFQVDKGRKRMRQWGSVLVPAGSQLVVRNASAEPLVLLLVTAPPPKP